MHRLPALLREPLVHFAIIGALVFALFGMGAERAVAPEADRIEVTEADVARLALQFRSTWRRAPTDAELARLVDQHVREEIYYREALALGLDRDDAVIRQRLRQKMEFILQGGAEALEPTEAELRAFYEARRDAFARDPRISFEQVLLDDAAAQVALAALAEGADPGAVGRPSLLPRAMDAAPPATVDGTFGRGFFQSVADLPAGAWHGPVASTYGRHLVRVAQLRPGRTPPLDEIRPQVVQEWRAARAEEMREDTYRALAERYEVVLPGSGAE